MAASAVDFDGGLTGRRRKSVCERREQALRAEARRLRRAQAMGATMAHRGDVYSGRFGLRPQSLCGVLVPQVRMARGYSVEQSLPAPGCAPQLGDDMGLQRGDAEFIEMLVMSSCFALRLPEPGGASRLNHALGSPCPAFGCAPRLAGEALPRW